MTVTIRCSCGNTFTVDLVESTPTDGPSHDSDHTGYLMGAADPVGFTREASE